MAYFRPFSNLTLFPLKRPARREENTSNMAATTGDVMYDVTCKSSIRQLMKTDVMTYFGHFARSAVYYKAGSPFS
jgi:hypothetical protein